MARSDYVLCDVCNANAIYDGNWFIRDVAENCDVGVLCEECSKTHELVVHKKDECDEAQP